MPAWRPLTWVIVAGVGVVMALAIWLFRSNPGGEQRPIVLNGTAVSALPTLDTQAVTSGEGLYATHCASCHGANLEGQPDWKLPLADGSLRAPPHDDTGHTWHHPDQLLIDITLYGGAAVYGNQGPPSNMPGFEGQLSRDEVVAIFEFIKSRWSQEARDPPLGLAELVLEPAPDGIGALEIGHSPPITAGVSPSGIQAVSTVSVPPRR